jgi:Domain of unknown function (DUF4394)
MIKSVLFAGAAVLCLGAQAQAYAQAANIIALSGDNSLAVIDSSTGKAGAAMAISGVDGRVLGIDVRPSDGMLYGLFADGTVATIDPMTAKATKVETLKSAPAAGTSVTADFNPVADALRIMASDGSNMRTKIVGGAVATDKPHNFAGTDMNAGAKPMIIAGAYSNAMKGAEKTALYTIDGTLGVFATQNPPNDGTQTSIGKLGVDVSKGAAFDIVSDASGANTGWLVANGKLHMVDIKTGKATETGMISGIDSAVRDIAVLAAK